MSSKKDLMLGLFIAAAGVFILLGKLGVFGFLGRTLWPLLLLVPGVVLHVLFFGRRAGAAILIPAGILTVYGLLFLICSIWGWGLLADLWPLFITGVGIGLFEYYWHDRLSASGLLPVSIGLIALSLLLLFFMWLSTGAMYVIAVLLILAGIWLMYGRGRAARGNRKRGW